MRLICVDAKLRKACRAGDRDLRIGDIYLRGSGTRFIARAKRAAHGIGKRERNAVGLGRYNNRSGRDGSLKRQEEQKDRHH